MSDFNEKPVGKTGKELNGPRVIAAGEHTMASTDEDITIVGLLATDIVIVGLHTQDTGSDIADLAGVCEADNLNIKKSAGSGNDGVVSYIVVRP